MALFDRLPTLLLITAIALAAAFHADFSAIALTGTKLSDLGAKLVSLTLVALAIERAVEIYLSNRFDTDADSPRPDKRRAAMMASIALSLAVSVVGVRLLAQMADTPPTDLMQRRSFDMVDIILTSLLLSGGADGLHQIVTKASRTRRP